MSETFGQFVLAIDGAELPDRTLIGGKAWSIARLRALGLAVPPAFVITTPACRAYLEAGTFPPALDDEIDRALAWLEHRTGRQLGGTDRPLLVSVRSGAAVSMPGMMDTVLNLGINDSIERALARESGNAAFARDTHRRFLTLFAAVVLRAEPGESARADPAELRAQIAALGSGEVPVSPREQLGMAVEAVFASWNSRRAKRYRRHHGIAGDLGTAVTVQAMVFGNLDERSGTGVLFSRDPLTGEPEPYGEYLPGAQGEDVVSGKVTPGPLNALRESLPDVHAALLDAARVLERDSGDVQDIEFTVQRGELYVLQTRTAKRAPRAAVRIALDMVDEGRIDTRTALERVSAGQVRALLRSRLAEGAAEGARVVASGETASHGVGAGIIVSDADEAQARHAAGEAVVLARATTSPEDVHGMIAACAVLTEQGGTTSHAALVCRDLGVPCIVGCGPGTVTELAGMQVTVDASAAQVYAGMLAVVTPSEDDDPQLRRLVEWAREACPIQVLPLGATVDGPVLDLDTVEGGEDPLRLPDLLDGCRAARGGAIESDEGVRAALAAGIEIILARQALPVMLAAIHAAGRASG